MCRRRTKVEPRKSFRFGKTGLAGIFRLGIFPPVLTLYRHNNQSYFIIVALIYSQESPSFTFSLYPCILRRAELRNKLVSLFIQDDNLPRWIPELREIHSSDLKMILVIKIVKQKKNKPQNKGHEIVLNLYCSERWCSVSIVPIKLMA